MPLNTWAYSSEVYLGGKTLGIEVKSDGIMVVGFYEIDGKYNKGELKNGDYILKVEDVEVNSIAELSRAIEKNVGEDNSVDLIIKRKGEEMRATLDLVYIDGTYKTGLYVKDSITGIGTLTYVDPETKIYGALGHEIIDSASSNMVEIKDGDIFKNEITSIVKSTTGEAGSKNAKYFYDEKYGDISKNTIHGIFGKYTASTSDLKLIEVGKPKEVKIGKATIYTVLKGTSVEKFDINITAITETANVKNMTFEIADKNLINETGGVVQGMSGSPIVQNDKIIGVVTHVIVDNPITGYGLFITKMLEEGER